MFWRQHPPPPARFQVGQGEIARLGDVGLEADLFQPLAVAQFHLFHLAVQDGQFVSAILVVLPKLEQFWKSAGDEAQQAA